MLQRFTIQSFISKFVQADEDDRLIALNKLCRTIVHGDPDSRAHRSAVAILDDIFEHLTAKERLSLAEHLAASAHAPRSIILSLLEDEQDIAEVILIHCPFIGDEPIISALASADESLQIQIAQRPRLSAALSLFIAKHCSLLTNISLVTNSGALLSPKTFDALATRFSDSDEMSDILLARQDLPIGSRQVLLASLARRGCALFLNPRMNQRYQAMKLAQAAELSTLELSTELTIDNLTLLIQHLVNSDQLTPSLLMRALVTGHQIFVVEAFSILSGVSAKKIALMMRDGDWDGLGALCLSMGLGERISEAILTTMDVLGELDKLSVSRTLRPMSRPEIEWLIARFERGRSQVYDDFVALLRVLISSFSREGGDLDDNFSAA